MNRNRRLRVGELQRTPQNAEITHPKRKADAPLATESLAESHSPQNDILHLQKTLGNAAVRRRLQNGTLGTAKSPGQRLPGNISGTMQTLFGDSAPDAQVHTGAEADVIARSADSDAATMGDHIYFRQGSYQPGSAKGNALIAREMTHIAQRRSAPGNARVGRPSPGEKQEAQSLSDTVHALGDDPQTALASPDGSVTPAQSRVVQRVDSTRGRAAHVAGVVTSKFLQGLGNILGPIGILWRWPLIKKNLNEYMGMTGKQKDTDRYGAGAWGDVARVLAAIAEILKEATIWMGLGTFIAGVCTAATMGGAAPAFAVLSIITTILAGAAALFKIYLVGHNLVRLKRAAAGTPESKMIKHQLFIDGSDAVSNIISALLGGFGAGNAIAKMDGGSLSFAASGGSAAAASEGYKGVAAPIVGKMVNDFAISPGMSGVTNSVKEGGKVVKNTDGIKAEDKGFLGGLTKDWRQITGKEGYNLGGGTQTPPVTAPVLQLPDQQDAQLPDPIMLGTRSRQNSISVNNSQLSDSSDSSQSGDSGPNAQQLTVIKGVENQLAEMSNASRRNSVDASAEKPKSDGLVNALQDNFGTFPEAVGKVDSVSSELVNAKDALKESDKTVNTGVSKLSEPKADQVSVQVEDALKKSEQLPDASDSGYEADDESSDSGSGYDSGYEADDESSDSGSVKRSSKVQAKGDKPGIGSRIKGWFSSKLSGIKKGTKRLTAKLMAGIMRLIGKFTKKGGDLRQAGQTVSATMQEAERGKALDTQSADTAGQMQDKTALAATLFEKAKHEE